MLEPHRAAIMHAEVTMPRPLLLRVFQLLRNCSEVSPPPTRLLAACMECFHLAAASHPDFVWSQMVQAGVLAGDGGW